MGYGIKLLVWGDYACFSRPEMKAERVSYDVITPSAARGILTAIYWKPAIEWVVDKIHVVNEIKFTNLRRNEVENKIVESTVKKAMKGEEIDLHQYAASERQQRAMLMLRDVAYVIEAHFEMTNKAGTGDTKEKHYNIAIRRARAGSFFHAPSLGMREMAAHFKLLEEEEVMPQSFYAGVQEKDLGYMLHHIDFDDDMKPHFFRANMQAGVVDVSGVQYI